MSTYNETLAFMVSLKGHPHEQDILALMGRMAHFEQIRRALPWWAVIRRQRARDQIETARRFANELLETQ